MRKPFILHIITGLGQGGAEKIALQLCEGLQRKGIEVRIIALSEKADMLPQFLKRGIPVEVMGMKNNPFSMIKSLLKIHRKLKKNKPDLIHAHMTHALIFSVLIRFLLRGTPVVFTPHSIRFGTNLRMQLIRWLKPFRERDVLFSTEQYQPCFRKDFKIIPNGIDIPDTSLSFPKFETFTFLSVGRLEHMKNHSLLINLIEELKTDHNIRLLIAGSGSLEKDLKELIEKKALSKNVELLGFRDDVSELYLKAHAFLMPSLWEGMPVSILEAGLAKLPVISTQVGSIPSLINENTGYPSSVENFKERMIEILNNYPEARKRGKNLYEKIRRDFSLEHFLDQHLQLYHSIIGVEKIS